MSRAYRALLNKNKSEMVLPTLNLQPNQNLESYSLVNFSRSGSGKSYIDSSGDIQPASANELPVTYDKTGTTVLGWLIEESRQRLNLVSASPSANEDVTVSNVAHTISFYGSGTVTLSGVHSATINGTDSNTRTTSTFTPSAGTLTIAYSGTCEYVQLEQGSFASSVILGEGSQVTRPADVADITDLSWYNQAEGTFVVEYEPYINLVANKYLLTGTPISVGAFLGVFNNAKVNWYQSGIIPPNSPSLNMLNKLSFTYEGSNMIASLNGGTIYSSSSSDYAGNSTAFLIGRRSASTYSESYIKSLKYYPKRLSNTKLQELTA